VTHDVEEDFEQPGTAIRSRRETIKGWRELDYTF
jgi:hypothetical protein